MIQHNIISAKNYAYIEIRQAPPLAEFISAARLFISDALYTADLDRICDFSQANLSHITHDDLMRFVKFAVENIKLHKSTRCALVAPDKERSGIFEAFAQGVDSGNFRVFMHPEEAVQWITTPQPQKATARFAAPAGGFDKILGGVA